MKKRRGTPSYNRIVTSVFALLFCASAAQADNHKTNSPGFLNGANLSTNVLDNVLQAKTVTGKVVDDKGEILVGVTVAEQGTQKATTTDANGNYSLSVTGDNSVLVFTYIGMNTKTETVGARSVINVTLASASGALQEVVVTALGIKREAKKLGYASTQVKVDEITQNRTTNVMQSLEGKIAGLDIAPPTAGAGSSTRIRLRGQAAFAGASNSPLIVINGLPMDQGARGAEGGNQTDLGDNLQQINQDDIESMNVLKGATAAALYGSRASNGAIIITTKSGSKNSKLAVDFTSNFTAEEALDFTNYQTIYGTGNNGKRPANAGTAVSQGQFAWGEKHDGVPTIQYDGQLRPYQAETGRIGKFYRTGTTFNNTLAISGGNASTSYRASFSNLNANGITPNNRYDKKIFNFGMNSKVTEKLNFTLNINYTNENNYNPPQVAQQGFGAPNWLHRLPLTVSLETAKNSAADATGAEWIQTGFRGTLVNPYFLMPRRFDNNKRDRLLATTVVRYDFMKWLYLQGRVNMDVGTDFREFNTPNGTGNLIRNDDDSGWRGAYDVNTGFRREMNSDFLLGTNNHKFGDFSVEATVGGNIYTANERLTTQGVTSFVVRDLYNIQNGLVKTQNYNIDRRQVNSLYAFVDFGYKNFLYLNVTTRTDWFSVLTPSPILNPNPKNSYNYPSASASFVFSELLPNAKWLTYGKLRASYADVGSANGINFAQSALQYSIAQQLFGNYAIATINGTRIPNAFIQPYSVSEKEIGLEVKTLNSRLNFDLAVYEKITRDQIVNVNTSTAGGYLDVPENLGKLRNRGLEALIDGTPIKTGNFTWNISANAAYNISRVLALAPGVQRQIVGVPFNQTGNEFLGALAYDVGKEMNQLIARTYMRNAAGQIVLKASGNLEPSAQDVNFGSANSKVNGGITNTFRYKSLSLLVHIDGKFGGKFFSSTALNGLRQGLTQASLVGRGGVTFDGVLPDGSKNTKVVDPQQFYAEYRNQQIADPFVFSSDFIKLRNITLTYDFSSMLGTKIKFVKGLSLSASARNVAVLMKRVPDLDPEAFGSSGDTRLGYEQTTLPTTRMFGFNLNVKF